MTGKFISCCNMVGRRARMENIKAPMAKVRIKAVEKFRSRNSTRGMIGFWAVRIWTRNIKAAVPATRVSMTISPD